MSTWHAVSYPLKPGSEAAVKELFRRGAPVDTEITDAQGRVTARLIGMLGFVGPGLAVRVIEFDGPLRVVTEHLRRQPGARQFQQAMNGHLAVDRDMSDPASAREFFARSTLECVVARRRGEQPQ